MNKQKIFESIKNSADNLKKLKEEAFQDYLKRIDDISNEMQAHPERIKKYKDYQITKDDIKKMYDDVDYETLITIYDQLYNKEKEMKEAEYKGKDVELNQPMRGDVKKYKVYVKDPQTKNIKKVNFGDKNMEIKRDDPERRKAFRARHNCDQKKDKTTPGYWSCKFWSTKSVSDLLKEVIEPETVDVSSIQFHDELCPMIWDGDKMKEDVRKILLKNAKRFIEFSGLEDLKFKDVILTGSMANYNYNENSDLDVHIVLEFDQIANDEEFVNDYLKMKKSIWNDRYPIQVKGHDVEVYYQDAEEPHHSTGTYSLMNDKWINEPTKKIIDVNVPAIKEKGGQLMYEIDDLAAIKDSENFLDKYNTLKDKIKKMRQIGLETGGEFSTENLTFKVLRNNGYLGKLINLKEDYLTKELSLNQE